MIQFLPLRTFFGFLSIGRSVRQSTLKIYTEPVYILRNYALIRNYSKRSRKSSNIPNPVKMTSEVYPVTGESKGSPIILLHGLLANQSIWANVVHEIVSTTNREVIAVDLRNHGRSPHTAEMTYNHIAADIFLLMKDMKLAQASLVGQDLGGRAAMTAALLKPSKIDSLVVLDPTPRSSDKYSRAVMEICTIMTEIQETTPQVDFNVFKKEVRGQLKAVIKDKHSLDLVLDTLQEKKHKLIWEFNVPVIQNNFIQELSKLVFTYADAKSVYEGSVLQVASVTEGEGLDADIQMMQDFTRHKFPKSSFVTVMHSGAWISKDDPESFINTVCPFLSHHQK